MTMQEDIKRLEDSIDQLSSFGEKIGRGIRKSVKWFFRKIYIGIIFFLFGIFVGFFLHFLKSLVGIKHDEF